MRLTLQGAVVLLAISGSVWAGEKIIPTVEIKGPMKVVRAVLIKKMLDNQYSITTESETQVTFQKRRRYPVVTLELQFVLLKEDGAIRVTMGRGEADFGRGPLTGDPMISSIGKKDRRWVQQLLDEVKLSVEKSASLGASEEKE